MDNNNTVPFLEFMSIGLSPADAALLREIAAERGISAGMMVGKWVGAYRKAQEIARAEVEKKRQEESVADITAGSGSEL